MSLKAKLQPAGLIKQVLRGFYIILGSLIEASMAGFLRDHKGHRHKHVTRISLPFWVHYKGTYMENGALGLCFRFSM